MSDNKIGTNQHTGLRVQIDQSRVRQTSNTSFGHVLGEGLSRSADAVLSAGQLAAPFIPGGAVLSAAINGVGTLKSSVAGQTASSSGAMTTGVPALAPNATGIGGSGTILSGTSASMSSGQAGLGGDMMTRMERMQEMNQSFNMQYLQLQQNMQDESRRFTLISNIMKTKHDTAKNSISNVR